MSVWSSLSSKSLEYICINIVNDQLVIGWKLCSQVLGHAEAHLPKANEAVCLMVPS